MNLILLTRDGPEHRYVANQLDRAIGLECILIDAGPPRSRRRRLRQLSRRYSVPQMVSRAGHSGMQRLTGDLHRRQRHLTEVLGPDSQQFNRPDLIHVVHGVNTSESWQVLQALKPERILLYGTGIVGSRALSYSHLVPLNMHTGISPHYRGSSCAFWPLHNQELDLLGATVHEVTSDLDGGRIFATGRAHLEPTDGVHHVFGRCVLVGAALFTEILRQLSISDLEPIPQDLSIGREYRAAMRGPLAELRVRRAIRHGLIRDYCTAHDAQ